MENFNEGLVYAGLGFSVVFAVLIVLMVVIILMKVFAKREEAEAAPTAPVNKQSNPATAASLSAAIDTNETIAVISATVAAMSGDDPNKRLRVKSIKDQSGNVLWSTNK